MTIRVAYVKYNIEEGRERDVKYNNNNMYFVRHETIVQPLDYILK